jgi:Fe2+ or Zn2+ uptake regulation protein
MMSSVKPHDCSDELRESSLKVTPARLGVLSVMEHATTPLDVVTVAAYLRKNNIHVDKVTVFRILNSMRENCATNMQGSLNTIILFANNAERLLTLLGAIFTYWNVT